MTSFAEPVLSALNHLVIEFEADMPDNHEHESEENHLHKITDTLASLIRDNEFCIPPSSRAPWLPVCGSGIHLPVTDPRALVDDWRPLVDHHPVLNLASVLVLRTALPIGLAAVAKMLVKFSTHLLAPIDILINRLLTDFADTCFCKGSTDRFGTPWFIAKLGLDLVQQLGAILSPCHSRDSAWRWATA